MHLGLRLEDFNSIGLPTDSDDSKWSSFDDSREQTRRRAGNPTGGMTRRETVSHIRSLRPSGISLGEHSLVDNFLRCLTSRISETKLHRGADIRCIFSSDRSVACVLLDYMMYDL